MIDVIDNHPDLYRLLCFSKFVDQHTYTSRGSSQTTEIACSYLPCAVIYGGVLVKLKIADKMC